MYIIISPRSRYIFIWSGKQDSPYYCHGVITYNEPGQVSEDYVYSSRLGLSRGKSFLIDTPEKLCFVIKTILQWLIMMKSLLSPHLCWISHIRYQILCILCFTGIMFSWLRHVNCEKVTSASSGLDQPLRQLKSPSYWRSLLNQVTSEQLLVTSTPGVHQLELISPFPQDYINIVSLHEHTPHSIQLSLELPYRRIFTFRDDGMWYQRYPSRICFGRPYYSIDQNERIAILFQKDRLKWIDANTIAAVPRAIRSDLRCHSRLRGTM